MKKSKWMILLLVMSAVLSFVIPVGAKGIDLNFGPLIVNSDSSGDAADTGNPPACHDTVTCDAFGLVADLRAAFAENKLVPKGEWLNNKLRETRKEIADTGCKNYSMEETMNSIVLDHVDYCKNTANPHINDKDFLSKSLEGVINAPVSLIKEFDQWLFKLINTEIDNETLNYIYDKTILNNNFEYAYSHNCNATALSYAMCRQGYDVQAHAKKGDHYDMNQTYRLWQALQLDYVWSPSEDETMLEAIENKMAEWPDGTVIFIFVKWKKLEVGHSFTAEKINGEIVFIDPQDPTRSSEYLRNKLVNDIDLFAGNYFFRTNDIDFSKKLDQLTEWVDRKEIVEETDYFSDTPVS